MGSRFGDTLSVPQATDIFPIDFLIAKGWPPMSLRFTQEFFHCSAYRGCEQKLPGYRIVKLNRLLFILKALQKISSLPISRKFGIVAIKIAFFGKRKKWSVPQLLRIASLLQLSSQLLKPKLTKYDQRFRNRSSIASPSGPAFRMFHGPFGT